MTADMSEQFLTAAGLRQHPGKKLIKGDAMNAQLRQGGGIKIPRLRKVLDCVGRGRGIRGFGEKIERTIRRPAETIIGGVCVLHQMVPPGDDKAAETVDEWIEHAAGCVLQQPQIATARFQAPGAGDGGMTFILLTSRVEVPLPAGRVIAGENDSVICAIAGADVIAIRRLVRHFDNLRSNISVSDNRVQVGNFVKLPIKQAVVTAELWG